VQNEQIQLVVFLFNTWWVAGITAFVVVELPVLLLRPLRRSRDRERARRRIDLTPQASDPELPIDSDEGLGSSVEAAHAHGDSRDFEPTMENRGATRGNPRQSCQARMRGRRGGWRRRGR